MESYIVSARKYRPLSFDSVVGQSHVTTTLKNALKNKQLAQAFLFCGPRGVGKTTCARILAKTINCLNPTADYEACGVCESCTAFARNSSLNIYELDAASNNSVDDIRNLVEQVRFPPQIGKRKVYIIDEVHMLSTAAFNAFLKTLEEPPSYVIFILATTEKHKIIPTILSRCQIFDFKRIEVQDMANHLESIAHKEEIGYQKEALELIAQKADGGLRDALSMFDMLSTFSPDRQLSLKTALDNLHVLDYDYYFQVTQALLQENMAQALLVLDDILRQGFDGHEFIAGLSKHFRDLLVCQDEKTVRLLEVSERVQKRYLEQAQEASPSFLLSGLNLSNQAEVQYKTSKNPRLLLELALMKIAHVPSVLNLSQLPANEKEENADSLKKKVAKPEPQKTGEPEPKTLSQAPVQTKPKEENAEANKAPAPQTDTSQNSKKKRATTSPPSSDIGPNLPLSLDTLQAELDQSDTQENAQTKLDRDSVRVFFEFYKKIRTEGEVMRVLNKFPEVKENALLVFHLTEGEMKDFESFRAHFEDSIRKKLRNPKIQCEVKQQKEQKVRPYTNYQKYEYLSQKNPVIEKLKDILGLDLDK